MPLTSPYTNNSTRSAVSTDYGIKVAKPGYSAISTASGNLIFSSSWPSLQIAYQTTITSPALSTVTTVAVPHGLKYPPLAYAWLYGPDPSGIGNTVLRLAMPTDSTNVYLGALPTQNLPLTSITAVLAATKVHVKVLALDLTKDIDYTLAPGDAIKSTYDSNFGIKLAKDGKSVDSKDLRDFILHSRAQSPLVLAVKTEATSTATSGVEQVVQYTSKLPYPAWVYGFTRDVNGKYTPAPYYAQAYPKLTTDGSVSYILTNTAGGFSGVTLVILRDPMFAATSVTAQY